MGNRVLFFSFLLFSAVIFLSLFAFYPAFGLGLFGDDWLSFWKFTQNLGPGSESRHWNWISYYLTSYGPQDIIMGGILRNFFGFHSAPYYFISYILRIFAALSLFPLMLYLTKNKLASFFAVLFFSVSVIGFDTTNWVFNMPSYTGMAFFSLFLYMFLRAREEKGYKSLLISGLFYYLAYTASPIRFTGLIPFVITIELFWFAINRNKEIATKVALRLLFIFFVVILIAKTGTSMGAGSDWRERFLGGFTMSQLFLSQGRFDFLFYPLVTFGGMLAPDLLMPLGKQFILKSDLFFSLIPFYLLFLILSTIITKDLSKKNIKDFWKNALVGFFWIFLVMIVFIYNRMTFLNGAFIYMLTIGGFFLILIISIMLKSLHKLQNPQLLNSLFITTTWTIISFLPAWWWAPNTIFPTSHRYLIGSAVGMSMLVGILVSLAKSLKSRYIFSVIFFGLIIMQIISTREYLDLQLKTHGSNITEKIWASIPYVPEAVKYPGPKIFYFEASDGGILHDAITFGFPPHMALIYNMREEDGLTPTPMEDWKDVISAAKDGTPFHRYNYFKPLPLDKIFAFRLDDKDNLIDITEMARKKIIEETSSKTP